MKLAMIGLGKMGSNMTRRLMRGGHEVVVSDLDADTVRKLAGEGAVASKSIEDAVSKLEPPRVAWVMVPAGRATESVVKTLGGILDDGDIVVDGGNSYYKDDIRHAEALRKKGIRFVDCGTSGGVWGIDRGYCLMIGGDPDAVEHVTPAFRTLAPGRGDIERTPGREKAGGNAEEGWLHCGPVGAGHFVKMVHNGIEYGLMQAYAEGFDILRNSETENRPESQRFDLNLADVAEVWRRGSVIGSWLLDLTAAALLESPKLEDYEGWVEDSGEGRWTVEAAVEQAVSAEVITSALFTRFRSRRDHTFAERVLSAMRYKFGGHAEKSGN